MAKASNISRRDCEEERAMPVVQVVKIGLGNPVVRQIATNMAINLVSEVGIPAVKHGANKLYQGVSQRRQKSHH